MLNNESDYRDLDFEEDILPPGQKTIITRNILKFNRGVKLLLDSKQQTGYSAIALVTGGARYGESVALLNHLNTPAPPPPTGSPPRPAPPLRPDSPPTTRFMEPY